LSIGSNGHAKVQWKIGGPFDPFDKWNVQWPFLRAIPSNICIIHDNADVLFESGGETSQEVLDLLEKIFSHCKNVSFLLTTRASLQSVLRRKFAGHTSVGVVSLDRKSSQMQAC
jgi:hypothetical protein